MWPLDPVPHVVRAFRAPQSPYGPGHRGVDFAGDVGQQVVAIGDGTVAFAGSVAGRGVVVVDHGGLRSTYEPITPLVPKGARVKAGQPIGSLQLLHSHCAPDACLHLGVKRGGTYLDPLSLLGGRPVRLKPLDGLAEQPLQAPAPPGFGALVQGRELGSLQSTGLGAEAGLAVGQARG